MHASPSPTPVRDGFRAIWRRPTIFLAELAWRWSWGGAALILTALALYEYLQTLIVTPTDLILLKLRHPLAVSRALADIFHGSGPRVVLTAVVLIPAFGLLWILLGALGRFTTLRALISQIERDWTPAPGSIRSLIGLHGLRVALALAGVLSFLGAALAASLVSTRNAPHVGLATLLFLPLAGLVSVIWSWVNWFLSISTIFTVRDGADTFGSVSAALEFSRRSGRKITSASFWFGAMHLVAFVIGTTVVAYPLALASLIPPGITLLLMVLVLLAYFAVADYLYLARLAGYLAIVEWDRASLLQPEIVAPAVISPPTVDPPNVSSLHSAGSDEISEDEPLFSSRPRALADEDCDEPIMPGFSPGEPLPGR
jgi:hypothetical protein